VPDYDSEGQLAVARRDGLDQPGVAGIDRLDGVELRQEDGRMPADEIVRAETMDCVLAVVVVRRLDPGDQPLGVAAQDPHARGECAGQSRLPVQEDQPKTPKSNRHRFQGAQDLRVSALQHSTLRASTPTIVTTTEDSLISRQ
jgi:hypothetical protein